MKNLTSDEFNLLLCSTGFLPPRNEDEHLFFEEMHESYNVQTKNRHVDIDAIINGTCKLSNPEGQIIKSAPCVSTSDTDVSGFSMAARNFDNLPQEVIDKIRKQHKGKKE